MFVILKCKLPLAPTTRWIVGLAGWVMIGGLLCQSPMLGAQTVFRKPVIPDVSTLGNQVDNRTRNGSVANNARLGQPNLTPTTTGDNASSGFNLGVNQSQDFPSQESQFPDFVLPADKQSRPRVEDPSGMETVDGAESSPTAPQQPNYETSPNQRTKDGREIIRQRYPDGKVQIEREVAQDAEGNYFNHGSWKVYSRQGKVIAIGEYRRNVMHGLWQRHHTQDSGGLFSTSPFNLFEGPFISAATFNEGQLDGMWTLSDSYQRKIFEVPYREGQRHGTATWWFPSMTKMREVTFKEGLLDGRLLEWDEQNKLSRDEQFVDGKKIIRHVTFFRPKQRESEKYYLDARLEPDGEDNWWDAVPTTMSPVGNRVQHGPINEWYTNGQPKMRGTYDRGDRIGRWNWWHASGNKQLEGQYEKGAKVGKWIWRHENGMKAIEGSYENDSEVGDWRWWEPDGQVEAEEDFSKIESTDNFEDEKSADDDSESESQPPDILPEGNSEPVDAGATDLEEIPSLLEPNDLEGINPLESSENIEPAADTSSSEGGASRRTKVDYQIESDTAIDPDSDAFEILPGDFFTDG